MAKHKNQFSMSRYLKVTITIQSTRDTQPFHNVSIDLTLLLKTAIFIHRIQICNKSTPFQMSFSPNRTMNTPESKRRSAEIEKYLKKERLEFVKLQKEPKLLILGSSDSGKSTLLKQLKILRMHTSDYRRRRLHNTRKGCR